MSRVLERWNLLDAEAAAREVLPCCGSRAWAHAVAAARPVSDEAAMLQVSGAAWRSLPAADWQEAFDSHPRIGERKAQAASEASLRQSAEEQAKAMAADDAAKQALRDGNRRYEERFGRIFIVCASGKTAGEMLEILEQRMRNDAATELQEAAEQQRQITEIRLRRWMKGE
jgi:2-oxo-4-hydroxy-4-carboxy-5-ureidoimidazoline decarboxylase